MSNLQKKYDTKKLVLTSILTALVIILQYLAIFLRTSVFSFSFVLIPIVIGAATCGITTATWLGFVFGVVVLISGDANPFLMVDAFGTVVTVLAKGTLCGFICAVCYQKLEKYNRYFAVVVSAIICPLVNTGVFLLGCLVFFMDTLKGWAMALGFGDAVYTYMFVGLIGVNFLFEMAFNIVLSPLVVRLLNIRKPVRKQS
ncbi:MAG: ECF transporter S component [Clostridia bacterium]|nr:ECF transporter S component [Clostridia bacterium]